MKRRRRSTSEPDDSTVEQALAAIGPEELRQLVRDILPWLDEKTHVRLAHALVDRAAKGDAGWRPPGPTSEDVAEALDFAQAARRVGYGNPSQVDDYLRRGGNAFLRRDYQAALAIFRALLVPVSEAEIDLGQHEMVEEVLGPFVAECAARYVVATYLLSPAAHRAQAVRTAIEQMQGIGHFWQLLEEMERVAVEPLPDLDAFLPRWRDLLREAVGGERSSDGDSDEDRWLREVVQRLEGAGGLAALARSSRRRHDLRAWCRALIEARDWKAALVAHEEAADIAGAGGDAPGAFLDGAALAAQELVRKDLPRRLERAWRSQPSLLRLRRWLGSSPSKAVLTKRATAALELCPKKAARQTALLLVVLGNLKAAAKLLADAPGLGWSDEEHPGHLLFPIFSRLLGDEERLPDRDATSFDDECLDIDELHGPDLDEPQLSNPAVDEIVAQAGVGPPASAKERGSMLEAMQMATCKRLEQLTKKKRRRHYGHAASLAAACVANDRSRGAAEWMASLRSRYRRFPALQRELRRHAG